MVDSGLCDSYIDIIYPSEYNCNNCKYINHNGLSIVNTYNKGYVKYTHTWRSIQWIGLFIVNTHKHSQPICVVYAFVVYTVDGAVGYRHCCIVS